MTRVLLSCLLVVGCDGTMPRGQAVDPHGAYDFALVGWAEPEISSRGVLWRVAEPPVTVTAQRIPRADSTIRVRTADTIAAAIVERYAAGEIDGSMERTDCSAGGGAAICFAGWANDGNRRLQRRGVLLELSDDFLFLEVIGQSAPNVDRQMATLLSTLHEQS